MTRINLGQAPAANLHWKQQKPLAINYSAIQKDLKLLQHENSTFSSRKQEFKIA